MEHLWHDTDRETEVLGRRPDTFSVPDPVPLISHRMARD